MKAVWIIVLVAAGSAAAAGADSRHYRHIDDYGESEEAHLETIELPKQSHRSDLRQIVYAIKDVKSCLCKLISVQKKQIEMEMNRRAIEGPPPVQFYDPIVGKPVEVEKKDIPVMVAPHELPSPIPGFNNAPQGSFLYSKAVQPEDKLQVLPTEQKEIVKQAPNTNGETTTTETISTETTTTEQPAEEGSTDRNKRQVLKSDFIELPPNYFRDLQERGFTFNSDEEAERAFLGEIPGPANKPSDVVVNEKLEVAGERKAREAPLHPPLKSESDESLEGIQAEHLTVGYDVGQKTKKNKGNGSNNKERKAQITPLPRQKSIEFPAGSTYYSTGDDQKPVDYTLNIPQQTYYLVPGPAPGKNPMVAPVIGNYDPAFMNHQESQYPSHSLQAQYAPSSAEYAEQAGAAVAYHHEEEEEGGTAAESITSDEEAPPPPPPKEEKKKSSRKSKKQKKEKVSTTTPAFES